MYLLGPAESHPHFEPPEEQLDHLVVLEIHGGAVQLRSGAPVVPQDHRGDQPQQHQPQHCEAGVEHQRRDAAGGACSRPAGSP